MKTITWMVCLTFIFAVRVQADTLRKADAELISTLSEFSTINKAQSTKCQEAPKNYSLKKMSSIKVDPKDKKFSGSFCLQVMNACTKATGNYACAPQASEKAERLNNFSSIAIQARELHQKSVNSSDILTTCCKDNQKCKTALSKTTFDIGQNHTDEFFQATNKITLSSKTISNCSSIECLEEIYFHELGHACQAAIVSTTPKENIGLPSQSCTGRSIPHLDVYKKYFGETRIHDYKEEMKVLMKKNERKFDICPDQWFDEGMASIIFSKYLNTPLHFQRTCESFGGPAHPPMTSLIQFMDFKK